MDVTIYHNPRCSKSRATLALLEDRGLAPTVVKYLQTPPDAATLTQILALLGRRPRELMRLKEPAYQSSGAADTSLSDPALIDLMVAHPTLIERPIVVVGGTKAAVGRPPEAVLDILP